MSNRDEIGGSSTCALSIAGHYACGNAEAGAQVDVFVTGPTSIRVLGRAYWGSSRPFGPNIGLLNLEGSSTAEKVTAFLKEIQKAAEQGEFDDALEDLRKERQEHARKMIEARNKCGFHRMHQHEGVSQLNTPCEVPLEPVNHGQTLQTEAL